MKRLLISLLLVGVAVTTLGLPKQTVQTLKPGDQTYTLRLPSNPSAGYSWFLVSYDQDLLSSPSHQYLRPNTNALGAQGLSVWQFKVAKRAYQVPTRGEVTLVYARPWEINQANVQTFYFVTQQQG